MRSLYRAARAVGFAALAVCLSPASSGAYIPLGTVSSPITLNVQQSVLGQFSNSYAFRIADGESFVFSSFVSTGFTRRGGMGEFIGELFGDGGSFLGAAVLDIPTLPEGFPSFDLTFAPILLAPGTYTYQVRGEAISAFGNVGYGGTLDFAAAPTAIPEPSLPALVSIAALAVLAGRHRSRA